MIPGFGRNKNPLSYRGVLLTAFVGALTALLVIYIVGTQRQFKDFSPGWVFYGFIRMFSDIREGRIYEPVLTWGILLIAFLLTRRIVNWLQIDDAVSRLLVFVTAMLLALLLPFHLLAFISVYGNLACLHPYNLLFILLAAFFTTKLILPAVNSPVPVRPKISAGERLGIGACWVLFVAMAILMAAVSQQAYRGYDALWYHLPSAMLWRDWRHASTFAIHYAFHFPSNAEVLIYHFINARIYPILAQFQVLSAVLGSFAVLRICRLFKFREWAGVLAATAFLLLPVTVHQSFLLGNDHILGALLLITVCFILEAHLGESRRRLWLSFAALAYGIAIGTKYNALFFGPVFAVWIWWILRVRLPGRPLVSKIIGPASLLIILMLLPSMFWYCRNTTEYGNPVYPFQVSAFGHVVLKGQSVHLFRSEKEAEFVKRPSQWSYYPYVERFRSRPSLGATFAAFFYIFPFVPLVLGWRRRSEPPVAAACLFSFSLMAIGCATWFGLTTREPRYIIFVFGLMLAFGAGLIGMGPPIYRRAIGLLFAATLLANAYFLTELISERFWLKTDQAAPESVLPGFEAAINAAPAGKILALPYGPYSLMLYGDQLQNRVLFTFAATSEKLRRLCPDFVADFVEVNQPLHAELAQNPDYRLVCEAIQRGKRYLLYQRVEPKPKPAKNIFAAVRPALIQTSSPRPNAHPLNVVDDHLSTGWAAAGEHKPWIVMNWPAPVGAGRFELTWLKPPPKYRVEIRHDGEWRKLASFTHGNADASRTLVADKISLNMRDFDALRIRSRKQNRRTSGIFNLVEIKGDPPLTIAEIVLALGFILGVAAAPLDPRPYRDLLEYIPDEERTDPNP